MLIFNKQTIFKQHSKIFKPLENIQSQKKTFAKHHQKLSSPYKPFTLARSNLVTSSSFALGGSSRCEMGFFSSSLSQGNKILLHFCLPSARFLLLLLSLWRLFRKRFMTQKKRQDELLVPKKKRFEGENRATPRFFAGREGGWTRANNNTQTHPTRVLRRGNVETAGNGWGK